MSWPIASLKDVCTFENGDRGKNYPSRDSMVEKGIPFVNAGHIEHGSISLNNMNFITEDRYNMLSNGKFKKGDFLFCLRGSLGKYAYINSEFSGAIASSLIIIRPKDKVISSYLKHFLGSKLCTHQIAEHMNGVAQPNLSAKSLKEFKIPLPPLEKQKVVAAMMDEADFVYQMRNRAISRLRDLSHSIFHEMFGHPVYNDMEWKIEKLGDLTTKISSGSTPKGGSKNYVDDGIMFLRSQNVWRNRIELDDVVYIDEFTHKKMKKSSLKHGDILITKTGRINTENSSLGRAAMFLGEDDSANVNGHVYLVRPKPDVLKEFVLYIMTTPEYREYIRSVCVGGIDKRQINKEHLEEFPIIYPPIEKQKQFLKKLQAIEEQKARFNEQLKLAETLFLSLQQRAFRGEL